MVKETSNLFAAARAKLETVARAVNSETASAAEASARATSAAEHHNKLSTQLLGARLEATDSDLEAAVRAAHQSAQLAEDTWRAQLDEACAETHLDQPDAMMPPAEVLTWLDGEIGALQSTVDHLDSCTREAEDHLTEARGRVNEQQARLSALKLTALEESEADAARALRAAQDREMREHRQAYGLKLLYDTLRENQQAGTEAVRVPLLREVRALLEQFLPDAEVTVGMDLCIDTVRRNDTVLDFDFLSAGAREQFNMVLRLAMARLMAKDGQPMLMLLDDSFESTDDSRFRGIRSLLEDTARQMQVIVFTSAMQRFVGCDDLSVVELTSPA